MSNQQNLTPLLMAKTLITLTFFYLLFLFNQCDAKCSSKTRPNGGFNGMFVFGSSIVENGNNNFLQTPARADYSPYGIDFPPVSRPTGRLTNGKSQADRIGELLGLPMSPPFLDPLTKGVRISFGVNYASAGSGILYSTASNLGVISLPEQIRSFVKTTLESLEDQNGSCKGKDLVANYLFLFSSGANDIRAYFSQGISNTVTLQFFTANLTSSLATQITKLYKVGARKFAFLNVSPLGCTPTARATMPNNACNETLNNAAYLFNTHLLQMLNTTISQFPGFRFVVINFSQIALEFTQNPSSGGFSDVSRSCCEVSRESDGILCTRGGNACSNRSKYMYFDGLHPTDTFYSIVANRAYYSNSLTQVYPYNLGKLARLS